MMSDNTLELADTRGLWRRRWLHTPHSEDDSSCVRRMQGKRLHVNMRLPAETIEFRQAPCLSDLDGDQLRLLARAEGFAGTARMKNGICTWTRHINLRGPSTGIDSGRLQQTSRGLLETGIQTQYKALWEQVDNAEPQARMMTNTHGQTLILLWTATRFAMGRGWHQRITHTRSLPEHVDYALNCCNNAVLARAFDQEFCTGRIEGDQGIIEHSTQPMRCDTLAFDASPLFSRAIHIEIFVTDFFGQTSIEEYRVPERSLAMA